MTAQNALAKAICSLASYRINLVCYTDKTKRAIRPFVIGRRNWLFSDTTGGATASANLYSIIETCKANNVEAYDYLIALFKALPLAQTADDYEALLPWNLKLSAA